jgi:hypothetical protein
MFKSKFNVIDLTAFDRPLLDFAQRLLDIHSSLSELLDLFLNRNETYDKRPIRKLAVEVSHISTDSALCLAVEELCWRSTVFDRLRKAMRMPLSVETMVSTMMVQPLLCPPSAKVTGNFVPISTPTPSR